MTDTANLQRFAQSIYGLTSLSDTEVSALVQCPCAVTASHAGDQQLVIPASIQRFALHQGIWYWSGQDADYLQQVIATAGLSCGQVLLCHRPNQFVSTLQKAIVSLHETVLNNAGHYDDPAVERDLAMLVRQHMRHEHSQVEATVEVWLRVMQWRHRMHLNTVRRKSCELLLACSADCDRTIAVSSLVSEFVLQCYQLYTMPDLQQLVLNAVRQLAQIFAQDKPYLQAQSRTMSEALSFIHQHFLDPISTKDVAAALGLTATHLSHLCKKELGRTVLECIQSLRIDHAKSLLEHSDQNILQIALNSGFLSPEHFHRTFKRIVGQTPRKYRLAHA